VAVVEDLSVRIPARIHKRSRIVRAFFDPLLLEFVIKLKTWRRLDDEVYLGGMTTILQIIKGVNSAYKFEKISEDVCVALENVVETFINNSVWLYRKLLR
jgi:hypothetical protein